jgi:hypothetical protein
MKKMKKMKNNIKSIIESLNKTIRIIEEEVYVPEPSENDLISFYSYVTDINQNDLRAALQRAKLADIDLADLVRDTFGSTPDVMGLLNEAILTIGSEVLDKLVGINPANEGVTYYSNFTDFGLENVSDELVAKLEDALTDDVKSQLSDCAIILLNDMDIAI